MTSVENLTLATALLYRGFPLLGMDKSNPSKAKFQFDDNQEVKKVIQDYWSGSLLCEPRALMAAQKELKGALYDDTYS